MPAESTEFVSPQPIVPAQRLPFLDMLRGLAILGVLFSFTLWNLGSPPEYTWSKLDQLINVIGEFVIDTKFVSIFAFLFGAGSAQQWRRIELQGRDPTPIHLRRMAFLLIVGLVHGALLRNGDILAPYAILGMLLLSARRLSNRALLVAAMVLAFLPYAIEVLLDGLSCKLPPRPGEGATNLDWWIYWYQTNPLFSWPRILALMLAGVLADREQWLVQLATKTSLARWVLLVASILTVASQAAMILLGDMWQSTPATLARHIVMNTLYHFFAWSLASVYGSLLALICQRPHGVERLHWLAAVGRMAFTNYLLQAGLMVPICLAFDLFDYVPPTLGLLLGLAVAALEIPLSVWWLNHHAFGPLEWLWRTVTYGPARRS